MTGLLQSTLWQRLSQSHQRADMQGKLAALDQVQAVIEFDLQGHVLTANDNFLRTMGYSAEQIIGQHHRMFVDEETRGSVEYAQFWQRLAAGQLPDGVGLDQQGAPRGGGGQKHPGAGGEQHLLAFLMEIVGQPEEGAGFPPGTAKTN